MMGVHLAESHTSIGTISARKKVYFIYKGRVTSLSLYHYLYYKSKRAFTFVFQNARKWIKGSVSDDPIFSKAHDAHKEKIRMENLFQSDNKREH